MYSRLDSDQTRFMKLPQASASPSLKPLNPSNELDPAKLGAVARKFEALFMQMMLKSMRTAGFGGGALDSKGSEFYQQMYDERLSAVLSGVESDGTSRKPTSYLGLADMLVRQLGGPRGAPPTPQAIARLETQATGERGVPTVSHLVGRHPGLVGDTLGRETSGPLAARAAAEIAPTDRPKGSSPGLAVSGSNGINANGINANGIKGATAQDAGASKRRTFESPEAFVREMWPLAERAAKMIGGSPRAILAQAALETGWGKHIAATSSGENSHNLFGIKATKAWTGERVVHSTLEFKGGAMRMAREPFRVYESFEQSFTDYAKLLANSGRYREAVNSAADPSAFFSALQSAGYATDPNYAKKLSAIAEGDVMRNAIASLRSA